MLRIFKESLYPRPIEFFYYLDPSSLVRSFFFHSDGLVAGIELPNANRKERKETITINAN